MVKCEQIEDYKIKKRLQNKKFNFSFPLLPELFHAYSNIFFNSHGNTLHMDL